MSQSKDSLIFIIKVEMKLPRANQHEDNMWHLNTRVQLTKVDHQIMPHAISPVTLYRSCIQRLKRIHSMILCFCLGGKEKENESLHIFVHCS